MEGFVCGKVAKTDSIPLDRVENSSNIVTMSNIADVVSDVINSSDICTTIKNKCNL